MLLIFGHVTISFVMCSSATLCVKGLPKVVKVFCIPEVYYKFISAYSKNVCKVASLLKVCSAQFVCSICKEYISTSVCIFSYTFSLCLHGFRLLKFSYGQRCVLRIRNISINYR